VLDRVDLGVALLDGGGPDQVGDEVHARLDFRLAMQVHPLEHEAVVRGRGLESHVHGVSGVQGVALDGDLAQKGALLHGYVGGVSETSWK
jgi:hypothetical protein